MNGKRTLLAAGVAAALGMTGAAEAGVITVGESFTNGNFVEVDGGSGSRTLSVLSNEIITDVDVSVRYYRCSSDGLIDGGCAFSGSSTPLMNEISFALTSAEGTSIDLLPQGTFTDYFAGQSCGNFGCTTYYGQALNVTLTFDDEAPANLIPTVYAGTFQPGGTLADLLGEGAGGDWTLTVADSSVNTRHLALVGWELTITTEAISGAVSTLPPWGLIGAGLFGMAWQQRRRRRRDH